jgi:hypothetical protein
MNLLEGKIAFETGLLEATNDHFLHMGIGQIASMSGNEQESMNRLHATLPHTRQQ